MNSFKQYLIEAQFDGDNLGRVLNAFQRRMPKLLGAPIYRYGGKNGTDGQGVLYFFGGKAFRVRIKGSSIKGIDVWDEYHMNKGPSYFIDISKFGAETILASMTKLAKIIKNPEAGKIAISESLVLEMAKRVSDESFFKMAQDDFSDSQLRKMSWDDIRQIADSNDVLIPGYVKRQKVGKGQWDITPNAANDDDGGGDDGDEGDDADSGSSNKPRGGTSAKIDGGKGQPTLYITVSAQDPESGRWLSAADIKKANKMMAAAKKAVEADPTDEELKDPETMYGHMAQLVGMACKGQLRSLLIYGGPGTGKTYTIMKTVAEQGLVSGKDYVKMSGKATPISIYETLFMFREGGLVIFDDLDSMWSDKEATNILKAALDTSKVREISWASNNTINVSKMSNDKRQELFKSIDRQINGGDEEADEEDDDYDEDEIDTKKKKKAKGDPGKIKFPSTFDFTGRVIFISNLKKEEFDTAILSRSAKIGMDMTPQQILMRMRSILPSLGGEDISIEKKEELIQVLLKLHDEGELTAVTMREFTKGLDILRSGAPNWKELVIYA